MRRLNAEVQRDAEKRRDNFKQEGTEETETGDNHEPHKRRERRISVFDLPHPILLPKEKG